MFNKLRSLLSNFNTFRVKIWLDKEERISLYVVEPLRKAAHVEKAKHKYDDVMFCRYSLNIDKLFEMLRDLNSKGYYKEDFFVNQELIRIFNKKNFEKVNPGNITYKAVGDFYEGDYIPLPLKFRQTSYSSILKSYSHIPHRKEGYSVKHIHTSPRKGKPSDI